MEITTNNILFIIIIIGVVVLYFTLKNLLPSYFSEKGKNLATQEDVGKITLLVEQVKQSFVKETEQLKANLNLLTNIQSSLFSEERSAIIEYNDKYFKWLNMLVDTSMNDVNKFSNEELETHSKLISDSYRDFSTAQIRFDLFVENIELRAFAAEMKIKTMEMLLDHPYKCITSLQSITREWERVQKFESQETHSEKHKEYLDKFTATMDTFRKDVLENYRTIYPLNIQFQKMCRDHLYQLIKKDME